MKIKVTTKLRQLPQVEIDGKSIIGMDFNQRLDYLNKITEKLTDLPNWFEDFLFSICMQFGEEIPDNDFGTDVFELEL